MEPGARKRGDGARYALAYFTLFAIYGVASPYLPMLLSAAGYGPAAVGLLLAVFEVAGIVGPLVVTVRADARGAGSAAPGTKRLLAGTSLCVLAALPGLALARSPLATAASLVVLALGMKTMVPVMDASASSFAAARGPSLRGGYGSIRAPGTLGYILVALTLQFVPGLGSRSPLALLLFMGGAALAFMAAAFALPGSPGGLPDAPVGRPDGVGAARGTGGAALRGRRASSPSAGTGPSVRRRADPSFAIGIAVIALNRFAMSPINSFLVLYARDELGIDAAGGISAIAAASEIPLMLVAGLVISRIGTMPAIAISSVTIAVRLCVYAAFPSFAGIAAGQLMHSLCYGLFLPATVAFVSERFPPERRATGMAIYMGAGVGLPTVLGNALGGLVVESFGYRALFLSFTVFALASLALAAASRGRFAHRAA